MRGSWKIGGELAPLTTMRIGGKAAALCHPEDRADLEKLLKYTRRNNIPIMVLGQGSNCLFPDDGWPGIVILLHRMAGEYHLERSLLTVDAGYKLPKLVARTTRDGWAGLEVLEGIPGSVGGALTMNAGTSMGTIGPLVQKVEVATLEGDFGWLEQKDLLFDYRSSVLQKGDLIAISTRLELQRGDAETLVSTVQAYRERRKKTQPLSTHNSGSIFRNPPGDFAARLIEACGAKGMRHGGAVVSRLHANFIVNDQNATASDVLNLMAKVRLLVYKQFGITLQPEICLIGANQEVWRGLNSSIPPG